MSLDQQPLRQIPSKTKPSSSQDSVHSPEKARVQSDRKYLNKSSAAKNNQASYYQGLLKNPYLLMAFLPQVGLAKRWKLLHFLDSAADLLLTDPAILPIPEVAQRALKDYHRQGNGSQLGQHVEACISDLHDCDGWLVTLDSEAYSPLLRQIYQPPTLLFGRGEMDCLSATSVAIVGARSCTPNGEDKAFLFAAQFASLGIQVVSGLALGIDGAAHRGVLSALEKYNAIHSADLTAKAFAATLGVLGSGIDRIYPAQHQSLGLEIIAAGGALISEFTPGTAPRAQHFPQRNRIVSGLSQGVLVVEAKQKSGSLISARCALEQNREVFAVPGSINNPYAKGCHQLIKDGAKLVETVNDIIEELPLIAALSEPIAVQTQAVEMPSNTNQIAAERLAIDQIQTNGRLDSESVFDEINTDKADANSRNREHLLVGPGLMSILSDEPQTADFLALRLNQPVEQVLTDLLDLEIAGLVEQIPEGYIIVV